MRAITIRSWQFLARAWFTLIEVIVALTITSIVLMSVFQTYSLIVVTSKRLELARGLQQNTRTITETIASDIREGGIAFECYANGTVPTGCNGSHIADYAGNGTDFLVLRGNSKTCSGDCFIQYYLAKSTLTGEVECNAMEKATAGTCYLSRRIMDSASGMPIGNPTRLSDAATNIANAHFFLSGVDAHKFSSGSDTEGKVTMSFTLSLAPRQWLDSTLAEKLVIPVQTTVTQKIYKSN